MTAARGSASPAEAYLRAWHSRHAGAARVFADARDADGRSSYERLASLANTGASVLDVACGPGLLLSRLHTTTPSTHLAGVDLCLSDLQLAQRRLPAAHLSLARAQALPFADASFDLVVCHMALMLMDDPELVLAETRRVLRRGGTFSAITQDVSAAPDQTATTILGALQSRWKATDASLNPPPLGDARTYDATSLAPLVGAYFEHVVAEPFAVTQLVRRRELWPYLVDSIYGLDAMAEHEGDAILNDLALPDPVPWTVPRVQVQGRA